MKHTKFYAKLVAVVLLVCLLVPSMAVNADEPEWTTVASMHDARRLFQTEIIDGKIYAIGGWTGRYANNEALSSVEVYDPEINTWKRVASMTTARASLQTEVINGKIYAIGGYNYSDEQLSSVEVYDPSTDTWTTLASMSVARTYHQTEVVDGKIYALGGNGISETLSSAEVYDPDTNTWTTLASMNNARRYFKTEAINGKIYAIGGYPGVVALSTEVYDPDTDTWTTLASMTARRYNHSSEVIDGKIYAVGGHTASVEVYDPDANTWTTVTPMPEAKNYFGTAIIDGKLFVIGGTSTFEVYDPDADTWTTLASISLARYQLQVEVMNGTIYAIGGSNILGDDGSAISLTESYTPASQATPPASPTNLTATAGDAQVGLSWDAVSGADSYTMMRAAVSGGPYTAIATGLTAPTYTDTDVTNGTTYYYVVVAVNGDGDSTYSNEASATPAVTTPPASPTNLTATAGDAQVGLSWDAVSGADSYTVMRAEVSGGPYTAIATGITGTSYTDTDVTNGTTYYYVVVAVNSDGDSAYSNEASATPAVTTTPTYSALLRITMVTGEIKEYQMDSADIAAFVSWCDSEGTADPAYMIVKDYNLGPFSTREEHIVYDKISSFEILQYD